MAHRRVAYCRVGALLAAPGLWERRAAHCFPNLFLASWRLGVLAVSSDFLAAYQRGIDHVLRDEPHLELVSA